MSVVEMLFGGSAKPRPTNREGSIRSDLTTVQTTEVSDADTP
jgi:hypothetical protein